MRSGVWVQQLAGGEQAACGFLRTSREGVGAQGEGPPGVVAVLSCSPCPCPPGFVWGLRGHSAVFCLPNSVPSVPLK